MPEPAGGATVGSFVATAPAVFETEAHPVVVGPREIAGLVAEARRASAGRARLLLHPNRADSLHEMVIALPPHSFDHPHINDRSGKSFLALSGRFAVVCYDDDGNLTGAPVLAADGGAGEMLVRLRRPTWHTILPLAGDVVFLETITGPFVGNRFAPWFPSMSDDPQREAFRQAARLRVD